MLFFMISEFAEKPKLIFCLIYFIQSNFEQSGIYLRSSHEKLIDKLDRLKKSVQKTM